MSKQIKLWCCLFSIALNHSITEEEFFRCLNLDALVILLLILSRVTLLILPISDLVGLISLQVGLLANFYIAEFLKTPQKAPEYSHRNIYIYQSSVIYQATVKCNDNNTSETYIGLTENAFKTRYRNHTASFVHTKHRNSTELSKHVWSLKDNNVDYSILWRIISSSSSNNSSSKRCNLCLKEKFFIICRPALSSLNKCNELVSSCRHRNKAFLRNN